MASIIKRKKSYSVVYNYTDENGEVKQKWETWHTHQEALKRKSEIENQQFNGIFIPPNNQTVSEFLHDFVVLYGEKKWSMSTYDSNTGLIANYINPLIGDVAIQQVNTRFVDQFNRTLEKTKPVVNRNRKPKDESLPAQTRDKIHKLLSCAFKQAVKWEIIQKNPFEFSMYTRPKYKKRDIWNAEMIRTALDNGRMCEGRVLLKAFEELREKAGLPNVVFHSLRHSSTTYKLKLNHGDLKATQGDTGHAQIDMITDIYAHILDEDRKVNAMKFESSFYNITADLRNVQAPKEEQPALDVSTLIEQLQNPPSC